MSVDVLGIRHHGPGCARHVKAMLNKLKPDLILLEGPQEADPLVPLVVDKAMKPPVALLAYQNDVPQNAAFYPFAVFSPEWQTMLYSQEHKVELRFFDLPLAHSLAIRAKKEEEAKAALEAMLAKAQEAEATEATQEAESSQEAKEDEDESKEQTASSQANPFESENQAETTALLNAPSLEAKEEGFDPLDQLAQAAGYPDSNLWWENNFELRKDSSQMFEAILLAMEAAREQLPESASERDLLREAWMRKKIREAQKEGFERIVVVCGAFHAPVLHNLATFPVKKDNALLKGLPKVKVGITFVPWTYDRLSLRSGYGAGITSPGFYEHVFKAANDDGTLWLSKVARLLRKEGFDISVAHVIETVRLVQTLCAMRQIAHPGLAEFNEAITTVMGFGDDIMLKLVNQKLIIGKRMGSVPKELPKVPLLASFESMQKKLRLPFIEEPKSLELDLRKELDLKRSTFIHRLLLLGIRWGTKNYVSGTGTFKEAWTLKYTPDLVINIIEKAVWGNNVESATYNYAKHQLQQFTSIEDLTNLLQRVIYCDMPHLCDELTNRIDQVAVSTKDMTALLKGLAPLCTIVRYGNVRKLDFSAIAQMIKRMLARIQAGALLSCININEESARELLKVFDEVNASLQNLNDAEYLEPWHNFLSQIHGTSKVHPLLCGAATRILRQSKGLSFDSVVNSLSYYTTKNNVPLDIALYIEGFLYNSGSILSLDDDLFTVVDNFICGLDADSFMELLPVLRRTFSNFSDTERYNIGLKAKNFVPKSKRASATQVTTTSSTSGTTSHISNYECESAVETVALVGKLLGLELQKPEVVKAPEPPKKDYDDTSGFAAVSMLQNILGIGTQAKPSAAKTDDTAQ